MYLFEVFRHMQPGQMALFIVLAFIPIVPSFWAIWHVFHRTFASVNEKMFWLGLSVFVPVLGGLIYLVFGRKRGQKAL